MPDSLSVSPISRIVLLVMVRPLTFRPATPTMPPPLWSITKLFSVTLVVLESSTPASHTVETETKLQLALVVLLAALVIFM